MLAISSTKRLPVGMLQLEDLLERPVEVVRHVRDLLEETVGRVRHDPPGRSPPRSIVTSARQDGQVTEISALPSWLMRR